MVPFEEKKRLVRQYGEKGVSLRKLEAQSGVPASTIRYWATYASRYGMAAFTDKYTSERYSMGRPKKKTFEEMTELEKEEQIEYIKEMTTERDIRNQIVYARDMGREEGILEGEARGEAKGRAEGIAEGKAETSLAMLANGLDISLVSKCTGLSEQQILKLQKP